MSWMTFASPGLAVAAGLATVIPVAIHLLMRRRRKPIEWAAMELLREALRRVERKRRMQRSDHGAVAGKPLIANPHIISALSLVNALSYLDIARAATPIHTFGDRLYCVNCG